MEEGRVLGVGAPSGRLGEGDIAAEDGVGVRADAPGSEDMGRSSMTHEGCG